MRGGLGMRMNQALHAARGRGCRGSSPRGFLAAGSPGVKALPWSQVLLVPPLLPAAGEAAGLPAREASSAARRVHGRDSPV